MEMRLCSRRVLIQRLKLLFHPMYLCAYNTRKEGGSAFEIDGNANAYLTRSEVEPSGSMRVAITSAGHQFPPQCSRSDTSNT
jgi:hypothetical protein